MPRLSSYQQQIVSATGNIVVEAGAGSGKTHTLIEKIKVDLESSNDHRVIAAITFTIKASQEIKDRMPSGFQGNFIGTNNSFVINEIIKPFIRNVFGEEYNAPLTADYSRKVPNFDAGLMLVKNDHLLGVYSNNQKNFIFELALRIVERSQACQLYLKSKYSHIYIDEYQDCDKDMHALFMYICDNLDIDTFIVGDAKQSIYRWRGAHPESFTSIASKGNFSRFTLFENHRCCKQIQDYSNLLFENTRPYYKGSNPTGRVMFISANQTDWLQRTLSLLDMDKSLAFLSYKNDVASLNAQMLQSLGIDCAYIPAAPVDSISNETSWLYQLISKYLLDRESSDYDFLFGIPMYEDMQKVDVARIRVNLYSLRSNMHNHRLFDEALSTIFSAVGLPSPQENDIQKLFATIAEPEKYAVCFTEEPPPIQALTFHSSKGLEFRQVVLFVDDYNFAQSDDINNHYVASTRAEEKLILVAKTISQKQRYLQQLDAIIGTAGVTHGDVLHIV